MNVCVGEEPFRPKMSRRRDENDVGSSKCQISSIHCALTEGVLVADRKGEWRRSFKIEKAGRSDQQSKSETGSPVYDAVAELSCDAFSRLCHTSGRCLQF